ncbi:MAG TPA: hypothetical protein VMV27_02115 [Candidatus Binataceae bacterium]|nr:hypothetical protein [Candidatus Binataceae bacterium]
MTDKQKIAKLSRALRAICDDEEQVARTSYYVRHAGPFIEQWERAAPDHYRLWKNGRDALAEAKK